MDRLQVSWLPTSFRPVATVQLIFGYVKAMSHHSFLLKLLIALREIGCERLLWGRPQTDRFWPTAAGQALQADVGFLPEADIHPV